MAEIIPAIIAKNFDELKEKIKLVEPYACPEPGRGINWVQLDVVDGKFAPEKSWPYIADVARDCHPELRICHSELGSESLRGKLVSGYQEMLNQVENKFSASKQHDGGWPQELADIIRRSKLSFEAHLMIAEPEKEIDWWIDSGVKRILVHWEALAGEKLKAKNEKPQLKVKNLFDKCRKQGIELGIALNLETPIEVLDLFHVSCFMFHVVQLMSIAQIGAYGEPFDERVIPKIRALRAKRLYVKILVDGGINLQNAKQAIEAGADVLVVGSTIFNSENIGETIKELKSININKN